MSTSTTKKPAKPSKPSKPFTPPDSDKVLVLTKVRDYHRYLYGKFQGKYTDAARVEKWNKILAFAKTLDSFKGEIDTVDELQNKIKNWKKNVSKKEKKELKTGEGPSDKWSESEKIIWHMKHQFDPHMTKLKVLSTG